MVKREIFGHTVDLEIDEHLLPDEGLKIVEEECNFPEHGYFESTYQGKKLYYRKYVPKGTKPKAIIIWQHGIHGHSGCGMKRKDGTYTVFKLKCRYWIKEGYAVYAHDQLGHGFSEGGRFLIPGGKWEINRDDLIKFVKLAASEHDEDTPLFLSGDSYGGCLTLHAARYFQDHPEEKPKGLVGCTLNCPAIIGDMPPKPVEWVLRYGLAPFFPSWTPFFMPHPVNPDRIWKEEEPRLWINDPKNLKGLSKGGLPFCLGTASGLVGAVESVQSNVVPGFNLPFTINHGDQDYSVKIEGSEYLMEKSSTPEEDKVLNKIEGAYHDMYSQSDAVETMQKEIDWVNAQIAKRKQT